MQKRRQQRARRGLEMAERATSDRNVASKRAALAAAAGLTIAAALAPAAARGDVVWGNFETGTAPGFGALTNAGVQPWADPVAGNSITAPAGSGTLSGSKVLELTGSANFNFGQASGAALGFDFLSQNLRQAFFDNDQIEFDWYPTPDPNASAGFSQLYNVIVNSQGGGFTNVDGYSAGNANLNQYYYTGYNGILHHVVVNYSAYKAAVLASANPDGGGWLQFGIQPNAGGGAPADYYFDNFKFSVASINWNVDADGDWSVGSNWSSNNAPASGQVAGFGSVIQAPRTVTVNSAQTVGQINFDNANKYTIAGTSTLTLDSTSAVGITVVSGSHDITAPLGLAKDATFAVNTAGTTLTLTNLQSSSVNITKTGPGSLAVNNIRAGNLTISAGNVTVAPNSLAAGVSKVASLNIAAGAKLDLTNNKLITTSAVGSWNGSAYTDTTGLIASGYGANQDFSGATGIVTTQSNATGGNTLTNIGIASNTDLGLATFGGQSVGANDTLVMYTYGGDANLDGVVNGDDYFQIDSAFPTNGHGWFNGDFNYDGVVNGDDYFVIDSNFPAQGAAFFVSGGADGVQAVPEPASIAATIAIAGATFVARRRRHGIGA